LSSTFRRLLPIYLLLIFRNTAWSLSVSGPVLPLYVRSLGVDIVDWGFLATAHAVGLMLFEVVWGSLADRIDRRRLLVVALVCMSLVFPLYTIEGFIPYFFVFQFAVGAFAVAVGPTTRALIADNVPEESRGFHMGLWFTFFTLGSMIGPLLGTYISEIMGYVYAFYGSTVVLLAGAAVSALSFRHLDRSISVKKGNNDIGVLQGLSKVLSVSAVRLTFLLAVSIFFGVTAVRSFLPIYASELFGMSDVQIGVMLTLSSGVQLLATPTMGRLSDRLGQKRLIAIALAAASAIYLCYIFVEGPLQLTLVTLGISACFSTVSLNLAMLSKVAPREITGMAMGMYGSFEDLGLITGSLVCGFIWNSFGPSIMFIASAAISIVGLLLLMMVREN
jgi:DHA1 family multidrug resistance protein-like MFS transporter